MASSRHSISPEELRKFRHYLFVTKYGKKVLSFLYKCSFLDWHPRFCDSFTILSSYGIDCYEHFKSNEIRELRGNPDDMDITLINKIFECLWRCYVEINGRYVLDDRLTNLRREITKERNEVSHRHYNISQTELERNIERSRNTLESTLDNAKVFLGSHHAEIDHLKDEIRQVVPRILEKIREEYDASSSEDMRKLQDEIMNFWDQLYEYIQHLSQRELHSLYQRLSQILPYDWLAQYSATDPGNFTVSLMTVREKEFHVECRDIEGITVDQNKILDLKNPEGGDPKALIISGDAGSGKTTMLCSILEKWHKNPEDMSGLSNFQIVLCMQFRNHNHDNFDDYLRSLLPQVISRFRVEHVKSSILSSKCLILCDGFDEANDKSNKLFEDILYQNFSDMKAVITTRPGNTKRLTAIVNNAQYKRINLHILGLREEDQTSLIGKITPHLLKDEAEAKIEEMKRKLFHTLDEMDKGTRDILKTPLYFNLFILLYIECPDVRERISSVSTLYIELSEHKKRRIIAKTGISAQSLVEFDILYRNKSLENYKTRKYELSELDISNMKSEIQCQEVVDKFESIVPCYFNIKHGIEGVDIKRVFCYRHASELEFAAAGKICDDILRDAEGNRDLERALISNEIISYSLPTKETDEYGTFIDFSLLIFLIGILYNSNKNALYEIIDDIHGWLLNFTHHVGLNQINLLPFRETRLDPRVLKSFVSGVKKKTKEKRPIFMISHAPCMHALPLVLPELMPAKLRILIPSFWRPGRHFQNLTKTLEVASGLRIPMYLLFRIKLEDLDELCGLTTYGVVDELELQFMESEICDVGVNDLLDLEKLYRNAVGYFPISGKDLYVTYYEKRNDVQEIANVLHSLWQRIRRSDAKCVSLTIHFCTLRPEEDIRSLINMLTIQPLKRLCIPICPVASAEKIRELGRMCKERGLGEFTVTGDFLPGLQ